MRIVLVTHFYPSHGGGIEQVAGQLAARMVSRGAEIVWCASDTDAPPVLPGVRCEPMATFNAVERISGFPYPLWSVPSLARLSKCVREANAVHVHDCIYAGSLAAALMARRRGKPLIVTQHIGLVPLPLPLRPLLALANRVGARVVLQGAQGVAFISPAVRHYFESLLGPLAHFKDIPNGVDGSVFHAGDAAAGASRQALGFDPTRPLLLFVGRFVAKKRLPLIREMALLRPHWQWAVIGHGPEQPAAWGLPNVRVLPPMGQHDLAACYRAADLLVLPSHGEGFPLVVQEAMACGLPACITAQVAAGAPMPRDLWVELPEEPGQTARRGVAAVTAWLAQTDEARLAHGRACARYAAATWQWDAAAQAHLDWLRGGPA